jgi:uncharacterized surface protein with fasciclin (FAS1) repeats
MQSQSIFKKLTKAFSFMVLVAAVLTACSKNDNQLATPEAGTEEAALVKEAKALEQTATDEAQAAGSNLQFSTSEETRGNMNIVQIAVSNPNFSTLVAAVVKTGLAGALSAPTANLTVFGPTNAAFAQLPAPFNNAANIAGITNTGQINFLKNVLLYHVLGTEVFSQQISAGRSSAATLKPAVNGNNNTIYFSKTFNLIRVNGQSTVILPNLNANNGVIHVIDKVLLFPTSTIAQAVISNPDFSTLLAALVKTNLAGVFGGSGDFTVFGPTNAAFAQLPAPFNNAQNIEAIVSQAQINTLANILKYHVIPSRYFAWDLGILQRPATLATAPNNKVTTLLGYNSGYVKGDANNTFSRISPADILTSNGVIHVIDRVLIPN